MQTKAIDCEYYLSFASELRTRKRHQLHICMADKKYLLVLFASKRHQNIKQQIKNLLYSIYSGRVCCKIKRKIMKPHSQDKHSFKF